MKRLFLLLICCVSLTAATEQDYRDRQAVERLEQTIEQEQRQADADYEAWKLRQECSHNDDPLMAIFGLGVAALVVWAIIRNVKMGIEAAKAKQKNPPDYSWFRH